MPLRETVVTTVRIRPIWILLLAICLGLSSSGARAMMRCANQCGMHTAKSSCCAPKSAPPVHENCPCCAKLDAGDGVQAMAKASFAGIPVLVVALPKPQRATCKVQAIVALPVFPDDFAPPDDPPFAVHRSRAPPLD